MEPSLFQQQILLLARHRRYDKLSIMLEGILHRDGDWKVHFGEVKKIIDDDGLDGVDILVRSQLLLLRRSRDKARQLVNAYRETLEQVRGKPSMRAGDTGWIEEELVRYRRHYRRMGRELQRLLADHPHLREWTYVPDSRAEGTA